MTQFKQQLFIRKLGIYVASYCPKVKQHRSESDPNVTSSNYAAIVYKHRGYSTLYLERINNQFDPCKNSASPRAQNNLAAQPTACAEPKRTAHDSLVYKRGPLGPDGQSFLVPQLTSSRRQYRRKSFALTSKFRVVCRVVFAKANKTTNLTGLRNCSRIPIIALSVSVSVV